MVSESEDGGRGKETGGNGVKRVKIYTYQFPTKNAFMMHHKYVLIKTKILKIKNSKEVMK